MKRPKKLLGEILVEKGIITSAQLKEALDVQREQKLLIGEIIVKLGFAKEEDIAHCLSFQYGFPFLPLENYEIAQEAVSLIPYEFAKEYLLIPVDKLSNTLTVCMADPLNTEAIEKLRSMTSLDIRVFISTPTDIKNALRKYYNNLE